MDLLGCPRCEGRFVLRDAGSGEGWACRNCHAELRVIARSVPRGIVAPHEVDATHLQPVSRFPSRRPGRFGTARPDA